MHLTVILKLYHEINTLLLTLFLGFCTIWKWAVLSTFWRNMLLPSSELKAEAR